jgi:hypothetical protein
MKKRIDTNPRNSLSPQHNAAIKPQPKPPLTMHPILLAFISEVLPPKDHHNANSSGLPSPL